MTENTPPTPEEIRRLNRDLVERVIDKAESEPQWKQRLLDDPEAAIMEADFPEARQLREMQASGRVEETEVTGQIQFECRGQPVCGFFSAYYRDIPTY
jgi:hypothetical protein